MVRDVGSQDILMCVARLPNTERLFYGRSDFKAYEVDMAAEKPKPPRSVTCRQRGPLGPSRVVG